MSAIKFRSPSLVAADVLSLVELTCIIGRAAFLLPPQSQDLLRRSAYLAEPVPREILPRYDGQ